jgi:hypothetical protein
LKEQWTSARPWANILKDLWALNPKQKNSNLALSGSAAQYNEKVKETILADAKSFKTVACCHHANREAVQGGTKFIELKADLDTSKPFAS